MTSLFKKTLGIILFYILFVCVELSGQSFSSLYYEYNDFEYMSEMVHGDFDNDGFIDFIISSGSRNEAKIGFGNSLATPMFRDFVSDPDINLTRLVPFDIDNDGDLDLAARNNLYFNDGFANFNYIELPQANTDVPLLFADINGDGKANMIRANLSSLSMYSITNGDFSSETDLLNGVNYGFIFSMNTVDYDRDGNLDIILTFFDGKIAVCKQTSPLVFEVEEIVSESLTFIKDILPADFNKDGIYDFFIQSDGFNTNKSALILSNQNSGYEQIDIPVEFFENKFSTIGDFDKDGNYEIIHADGTSSGSGVISQYEYDLATNSLVKTQIDEGYADVEDGGTVDYNNDGVLDFYIYSNDIFETGIFVYLSEGVTDADNDGFNSEVDCNDSIANINPNAVEIPNNGIDEDCDGEDLLSSLLELDESVVNIYPNLVNNYVNVEVIGLSEYSITIYDIHGNKIANKFSETKFDLADWPNGTYIVTVKDLKTNRLLLKKVVKAN